MTQQEHLATETNEDKTQMSILDHLNELRSRLFYSLMTVLVGFIVAFCISKNIIDLFKAVAPSHTEFVQISPGEVFMVSMKIALYAGIYFASPVIVYQMLKFIVPGLKAHERKYFIPIVIAAVFLFTIGLLFGYYVVLPLALIFLIGYGSDVAQNVISIEKYISFCSATVLIMGAVFQIPMMMVFLSIIRIVSSAKLIELWKYVIIIAFILGGVLTPSPDPFGQTVVAGAILFLYALSIALIKLIKR